jgi:hypothetical protein
MATDPQSLFTQANCYACFTKSEFDRGLLELALLAQIVKAKSPSTPTDPQSLFNAGACYACYGTAGSLELMKLALLAQIVALGC